MSRRTLVVLFALAVAALATVSTGAQSVSLYADTGYTTYAAEQVNEFIDRANDFTTEPMSPITGGLALSGGVAFAASPSTDIRVGVDYLSLGTRSFKYTSEVLPTAVSPMGTVSAGDFSVSGSALGYTVGGTFLIATTPDLILNAIGNIGHYTATLKLIDRLPSSSEATLLADPIIEVEGRDSAVGFNLGLQASYALNSTLDLEAGVGYRVLKFNDVQYTFAGESVAPGYLPAELDLTGLNVRAGILFRF